VESGPEMMQYDDGGDGGDGGVERVESGEGWERAGGAGK